MTLLRWTSKLMSLEVVESLCMMPSSRELAEIIGMAVGFESGVVRDSTRPDGMSQKLLDVSRMSGLGWNPQIDLVDGIRINYDWYQTDSSLWCRD